MSILTEDKKQKTKSVGNGRGSIYFVAQSKRWRATDAWTDSRGILHRKSRDRQTQQEAQAALRELQAERERLTPGSKMLLADWLDQWLADERGHVRPRTFARYSTCVASQLKPELGQVALGDLTPRMVEGLCDRLATKYAGTTVRLARTILGISLKRAARDGHITGNPVTLSRAPKSVARPVEVLSPEQTKALLMAARKDHEVGPIVTLLVATGMRIGEAIALRVGDLDIEDSKVSISRTMGMDGKAGPPKSARGKRTISLPGWAVDTLRDHVARRTRSEVADAKASDGRSDWLFLDIYGRAWSQSLALQRFHQLLKANRLPQVRLHSLRHGHATSLLDGGADLLAVSRRLGHSSTAITSDVYTGTLRGRDDDLAVRLGGMLDG